MTEEEAKTKWCPYAKGQYPNETHCKTSDCMAWKMDNDGFEHTRTRNLTDDQELMVERIKTHPSERAVWKKPSGEPPKPPGKGWEKDGSATQDMNYVEGVYRQDWKRRTSFTGHCGLTK